MGEIIKQLGSIKYSGNTFVIELNHESASNGYQEIHIQNDKFRIALPKNEFLQISACIMLARRQLDIIKKPIKLDDKIQCGD